MSENMKDWLARGILAIAALMVLAVAGLLMFEEPLLMAIFAFVGAIFWALNRFADPEMTIFPSRSREDTRPR